MTKLIALPLIVKRYDGSILGSDTVVVEHYDDEFKEKSMNPNYKQLLAAKKVLPVLPYHVYKTTGYPGVIFNVKMDIHDVFQPSAHLGVESSIPFSHTPLSLLAINTLYPDELDYTLNKARAGLASHIDDVTFDSLEDIGESHKTVEMFRNRFYKASKFAIDFKKNNAKLVRNAKKFLASSHGSRLKSTGQTFRSVAGDLNNMYLEFNFGWMPLYHSLIAGGEAVAKYVLRESRQKIHGYADFSDTIVSSFTGGPPYSAFGTYSYEREQQFKYEIWMGGLLTIPTDNSNLTHNFGLHLSNVPRALWDLTSFSFIADYFVNIGEFIDNINYQGRKLQESTMYKSTKLTYTDRIINPVASASVGNSERSFSIASANYLRRDYTVTEFIRVPIDAADTLVRLNFHAPKTLKQVFNVFSVLAQVSGTLSKR